MTISTENRRKFLLKALAATASGGALAALASPAFAVAPVCTYKGYHGCRRWEIPKLPPKPDPKNIKQK